MSRTSLRLKSDCNDRNLLLFHSDEFVSEYILFKQSCTLVINVVVFVLANKWIMSELLGNEISFFPLELFGCGVALFLNQLM